MKTINYTDAISKTKNGVHLKMASAQISLKLLGFLFLIAFVLGCHEKAPRYTQTSSEIETVKTLVDNYNEKTWDVSIYADSSKTYYNAYEKPLSPDEVMVYHKTNDLNYSSRGFLDKDQEFEMVVTDQGKIWVNCWLKWQGTLAPTQQTFIMPIHLTYRFIEGKIVEEHGYWDPTPMVMALQKVQQAQAAEMTEMTEME